MENDKYVLKMGLEGGEGTNGNDEVLGGVTYSKTKCFVYIMRYGNGLYDPEFSNICAMFIQQIYLIFTTTRFYLFPLQCSVLKPARFEGNYN